MELPDISFKKAEYIETVCEEFSCLVLNAVKSKFYKKRGATFFYDITRKIGPLDFTQYMSKSSSF